MAKSVVHEVCSEFADLQKTNKSALAAAEHAVHVAPMGARPPVLHPPEEPVTTPAEAEAEEAFPYPAETYHVEA